MVLSIFRSQRGPGVPLTFESLESRVLLTTDVLESLKPTFPNSTNVSEILPLDDREFLLVAREGLWRGSVDGTVEQLEGDLGDEIEPIGERFLGERLGGRRLIYDPRTNQFNEAFPEFAWGIEEFVSDDSPDRVYFIGTYPWQNWLLSTDGTDDGTHPIIRLQTGRRENIGVVQNHFFYVDRSGLQRLDLEEGSTTLVTTEFTEPRLHSVTEMPNGGRLIFASSPDGVRLGILGTDGFRLLGSFETSWRSVSGYRVGDRVFFNAGTWKHDRNLWVTDGTPEGTGSAEELVGIPSTVHPAAIVEFNEVLIFGQGRWEEGILVPDAQGVLWSIDEGSRQLTRLATIGSEGRFGCCTRYFMRKFGELVAFSEPDGTWFTDGTPQGTRRTSIPVHSGNAQVIGSHLVFSHYTEETGSEPWVTDGTDEGTRLLFDLSPGRHFPRVSFEEIETFGDNIIFSGFGDAPGWVSVDGQQAFPLTELSPDIPADWIADSFLPIGDEVAFAVRQSFRGPVSWWITDGTREGTSMLIEAAEGSVHRLRRLNEDLYFTFYPLRDSRGPRQLWKLTPDGQLALIFEGSVSLPFQLNSKLLVYASLGETWELFHVENGRFSRIAPPINWQIFEDRLIGFERVSRTSIAIWESDGTSEGTKRMDVQIDIQFGSVSSTQVGGKIAFHDAFDMVLFDPRTRQYTFHELMGFGLNVSQHPTTDRLVAVGNSFHPERPNDRILAHILEFDEHGNRTEHLVEDEVPWSYLAHTATGVVLAGDGGLLIVSSAGMSRRLPVGRGTPTISTLGDGRLLIQKTGDTLSPAYAIISDGTPSGTHHIHHHGYAGEILVGEEVIYYGDLHRSLPQPIADLDQDGAVMATDIDWMFNQVAAAVPEMSADLNDDGMVDENDLETLLTDLMNIKRGDANLDGRVDVRDFLLMSANVGSVNGWGTGDFNGDDVIDELDLQLLRTGFESESLDCDLWPPSRTPCPLPHVIHRSTR